MTSPVELLMRTIALMREVSLEAWNERLNRHPIDREINRNIDLVPPILMERLINSIERAHHLLQPVLSNRRSPSSQFLFTDLLKLPYAMETNPIVITVSFSGLSVREAEGRSFQLARNLLQQQVPLSPYTVANRYYLAASEESEFGQGLPQLTRASSSGEGSAGGMSQTIDVLFLSRGGEGLRGIITEEITNIKEQVMKQGGKLAFKDRVVNEGEV